MQSILKENKPEDDELASEDLLNSVFPEETADDSENKELYEDDSIEFFQRSLHLWQKRPMSRQMVW